MLKEEFHVGPFAIRPEGWMQLAGQPHQLFSIEYGDKLIRERIPVTPGTQAKVVGQLEDTIWEVAAELRKEHECSHRVDLVDGQGERLAAFTASSSVMPEMTPGLIDDRYPYWLRSADRLYSQNVTLDEYAHLRAQHERPTMAWIADLLDEDVLTHDGEDWRAPGAWELRHIVGVGSFTGISGARAAALVGVNPSSFRKYTAREDAKNRQSMSFAMWHLLLHRLGIQRLPEGWS